jgi:hypothetical protein
MTWRLWKGGESQPAVHLRQIRQIPTAPPSEMNDRLLFFSSDICQLETTASQTTDDMDRRQKTGESRPERFRGGCEAKHQRPA